MSFGQPNWFNRVKEEHLACRENVALFDMSAFVKLEVEVGVYDCGFWHNIGARPCINYITSGSQLLSLAN